MKQTHSKRPLNGFLLLDKPTGMSSNMALQKVKRLFSARKAGHTGSLDPLASGMLPICLGETTKFSQFLLAADKCYRVTAKLGVRTSTGDAEGEIIAEREVPIFTQQQLNQFFDQFRGEIQQVPSMYSALKHQGQPLYKLARQGITVERDSRSLTIYKLLILNCSADTVQFELHCSKGTYVRTLVEDYGEVLGCGAHVTELRRLAVGSFLPSQMVTLADLEKEREISENSASLDHYLLPMQEAVADFPELVLAESTAFYLRQGSSVVVPQAPLSGFVRLIDKSGRFLGIGEVLADGKIAPRRLLQTI